jgi:hypothetical protein
MRNTLFALLLLPALALADAPRKGAPAVAPEQAEAARTERRMRLARTLGLAEVLDLDPAQALKLGDTLASFDDRRKAARNQALAATDLLRDAARGSATPRPTSAAVDGAIGKLLDARAQLQAIDREMLQAITRNLSPEQKARAALFLGRFRESVERHMWMRGMAGGPGGPGPGDGAGMRSGMGRGMMDGRRQRGTRMQQWGDDDQVDGPPPFADE